METIFFDLDKTVLDTDKLFNQLIKPALASYLTVDLAALDTESQGYWQTLVKKTDFDPTAFASYLAQVFASDVTQLQQIMNNPQFYLESVFPDAVPTLTLLQSKHTLGIFSEGNAEYQRHKLKASQLARFFSPNLVFIHRRKMVPELVRGLPASWVIDDNREVIAGLQSYPTLKPVWLNRQRQIESAADTQVIYSLDELRTMLEAS